MDDRGFLEAEAGCVIATLAEVGVLVYGARDETGDLGGLFGVGAEDEGEGGCERGGGLNCWEGEFEDVVAI